ncbi:MAG: hypothetical protein KCHDKBKB_01999 [Elusimicrobia bacterium]|nr:hypothetical protein [Elusimicrobiota bacterium]
MEKEEVVELIKDFKAHLEDTEGELAYWGERIDLIQTNEIKIQNRRPGTLLGRTDTLISIMPVRTDQDHYGTVRDPGSDGDENLDPGQRLAGATASNEEDPASRLEILRTETIGDCHLCPLGDTRVKLVFGVGNPAAKVMFIGEGPGYDEDRKGEPFVGKAGQLLDKIMGAIGLDRTQVYIANMVKCHPMKDAAQPELRGNDRPPTPEEMDKCHPFLLEQIRIIHPKIIVTLGGVSSKALLNTTQGITALRGQLFDFKIDDHLPSIKVLPTFHPAALLRDESLKKWVWEDMKLLRSLLT